MNPNETGNGLTLNVSESSNEQHVELALETADLYRLKSERAEGILRELQQEISKWQSIARKIGLSSTEIEQVKRAFR
jgi:serine/threonine-protein kinase HipA